VTLWCPRAWPLSFSFTKDSIEEMPSQYGRVVTILLAGSPESAGSVVGPGSKATCCTGVYKLRKSFQPSKEYLFQWLQWLMTTNSGCTLLEIHSLVGHGGRAKHVTLSKEAGWQWYRASCAQNTGWTTSRTDIASCSTTLKNCNQYDMVPLVKAVIDVTGRPSRSEAVIVCVDRPVPCLEASWDKQP
jgi:hypothetical protein